MILILRARGGFLLFPIGDRRCNRTRASVGNAGGNARPSLTNATLAASRQSTLLPLSPSSPGANGNSTIIPINVTPTDPFGLTHPPPGQLGLTDPLLGQPSSVVPLPDVIVTGGISGTTAPADGSGLYSYTASVGSPVSVPLNVDLPTTMSVFDTASTSVASAVVGVTTPPS